MAYRHRPEYGFATDIGDATNATSLAIGSDQCHKWPGVASILVYAVGTCRLMEGSPGGSPGFAMRVSVVADE